MPYKFNGKQFDDETGLYYYGARYMNPMASIWYGVDPLSEKYPYIGGVVYCEGSEKVSKRGSLRPTLSKKNQNINQNGSLGSSLPIFKKW